MYVLQGEVTLLEPGPVPDGLRLRTSDLSNLPLTSSHETIGTYWISAPGHITIAGVTRHLAANQSQVIQKLDTQVLVTE